MDRINDFETIISLTTSINQRKQYIKKFIARKDLFFIPVFTTDQAQAKDFFLEDYATSCIDLIFPKGLHTYEVELITRPFFAASEVNLLPPVYQISWPKTANLVSWPQKVEFIEAV